ncbi:MAG: hypothetical protein AAGJ35_09355, partial [Myxococcota bacterium]
KSPKTKDFLVERIQLQSETPIPLQVGGDARGMHQEVAFQKSEKSTWMADMSPQPQPRFSPSTSRLSAK